MQIIGTRDSTDTRKAERFFKERRVPCQFVDLRQRALTRGELENIARALGTEELLDPDSKEFARAGLSYLVYDPVEEALKNPLLLKVPIVRRRKQATAGYRPEVWQSWLAAPAS